MQKIIHHIRNIRNQPEHIKRHVLHVSVAVAGILLLAVWVHSLGNNFQSTVADTNIKKNVEPLSVLKNNLAMPKW